MDKDPAQEIEQLSGLLRRYQHEYYVENRPTVSDREYDGLFDRLLSLEEAHPELRRPDSPTLRVGSDLASELPEVRHTIPVLSLDKAYSAEEVTAWMEKLIKQTNRELTFTVEEKIDGISIVLYYEEGVLVRAVTRGNGVVGNDVTANVKTIPSVPLRLPRKVNVAVRGEIYLPLDRFDQINRGMEQPYANPRNLAAGTIRRIKSSEVARVPLNIFVYEGFFDPPLDSHTAILEELASWDSASITATPTFPGLLKGRGPRGISLPNRRTRPADLMRSPNISKVPPGRGRGFPTRSTAW